MTYASHLLHTKKAIYLLEGRERKELIGQRLDLVAVDNQRHQVGESLYVGREGLDIVVRAVK
jgi:hypothetical protein